MNKTKKAIKEELSTIFDGVLSHLSKEQKLMTKPEKEELRIFLDELKDAKIHIYSPVLIHKKINQIIYKRKGKTESSLFSIEDIHESNNKDEEEESLREQLVLLLKEHSITDVETALKGIKDEYKNI